MIKKVGISFGSSNFFLYVYTVRLRDMKRFKDTKVFQILKERWAGKDMETYFIQKNEEFIERLKNEVDYQEPDHLTEKEEKITYCGVCGGDASHCDGC